MTSFSKNDLKCFVCGNISPQFMLRSTSCFGYSDLDMRPAPLKRDTINVWVHQCPYCGYASSSIADKTTVTVEFLQRPEYLSCEGIQFKSQLAKMFYQEYMIETHDAKPPFDLFNTMISAAWACDDATDDKNAVICRSRCLKLIDGVIENSKDRDEVIGLVLTKADLLRRTGRFDELEKEFGGIKIPDETLKTAIDFELKLAKAKDVSCHNLGEAFKDAGVEE